MGLRCIGTKTVCITKGIPSQRMSLKKSCLKIVIDKFGPNHWRVFSRACAMALASIVTNRRNRAYSRAPSSRIPARGMASGIRSRGKTRYARAAMIFALYFTGSEGDCRA